MKRLTAITIAHLPLNIKIKMHTPLNINIEPENHGLEDYFPFPVLYSQVAFKSYGVSLKLCTKTFLVHPRESTTNGRERELSEKKKKRWEVNP